MTYRASDNKIVTTPRSCSQGPAQAPKCAAIAAAIVRGSCCPEATSPARSATAAAIGVAATSVLMAPYGTRLAHAISGEALKRVFAAFLMLVGTSFVISALR